MSEFSNDVAMVSEVVEITENEQKHHYSLDSANNGDETTENSTNNITSGDTFIVDEDYIFDGSESNELITLLGKPFFLGQIQQDDVDRYLQIIRQAVEEGIVADDDLLQVIKFNSYTTVMFLLIIINAGINPDNQDTAARCLAMVCNIYPQLWSEFAEEIDHIQLLVNTVHAGAARISHLTLSGPSTQEFQRHPDAYLGYDARDKDDYLTQGYDDNDDVNQHNKTTANNIAYNKELIMMWLLLLSQIFTLPLPHVKDMIDAYRATRAERESQSQTSAALEVEQSAGGELDLVSEFVRLVSVILSVAKQLPEEAYLYSIKLVAEVNFQFPLPEDNSCEIATCFSRIDSHEEGVNISQGLLHLLNENGYPNISEETPAILRLCTDLLYVHSTSEEKKKKSSSGSREKHDEISLNKGHFYTNDIKILIDLILREMRNIPYNCEETATYSAGQIALHGQVRYMYLELIDAILQESGWSSAGQCYLWADLKALIEELYNQEEDCEKRDFAYALLYKYKHYFVTR